MKIITKFGEHDVKKKLFDMHTKRDFIKNINQITLNRIKA